MREARKEQDIMAVGLERRRRPQSEKFEGLYAADPKVRAAVDILSSGDLGRSEYSARILDMAIQCLEESEFVREVGMVVEERDDTAELEVRTSFGKTFFVKLVAGEQEFVDYIRLAARRFKMNLPTLRAKFNKSGLFILDVLDSDGMASNFEEELERFWTRS